MEKRNGGLFHSGKSGDGDPCRLVLVIQVQK